MYYKEYSCVFDYIYIYIYTPLTYCYYCKGWESTLPTLTAGQPVRFVQNQVTQLEVNLSSHWPLPFLDCIAAPFSARGIRKQNSQV